MEPALFVLLVVAGAAAVWCAASWLPRLVVGAAVVAAVFGGVLIPSVVLAEVDPPVVRLAEHRAGGFTGAEVTYRVIRGDSLWRIAERFLAERTGVAPTSHDIARFWPDVYAANRSVIGDDPCLIHPGQMLRIPNG